MLIKSKPVTPGSRGTVLISKKHLSKEKPVKNLTKPLTSTGGRNNQGRITSRRMGGGVKRKYRIIDFKRNKLDLTAEVIRNEYDPNRSAFISLLKYEDGELRYIISPKNLNIGDKIISGTNVEIKNGNCMPLKNIPVGTSIHNIELKPGAGGKLCRSAGSFAQVLGVQDKYIMIKLSSRETRLVHGECMATVGVVSNQDNKNKKIGKAGIKRHLGIRPTVRGVVMNPVDHPHGGGEGRTSGGRHPSTPWGMKTKGKKTRKIKFTSKMIISRRAKK